MHIYNVHVLYSHFKEHDNQVCLVVAMLYHRLLSGAVNEFTPTVHPARILLSSQCGQYNPDHEQLREVLQQIEQKIPPSPKKYLQVYVLDNYPSVPSSYYNITSINGGTVLVYCDMEGTNCEGEGGWTRVAYVNMTQPGATYPQGLEQKNRNNKHFMVTWDMVVLAHQYPHSQNTPRCVDRYGDTSIREQQHFYCTTQTLISLLMMLMLMECPSHMGILHVNTSGHMAGGGQLLLQETVHMIVHVNKTLLLSLHHMLVLTTTVSLVFACAALLPTSTLIHCGMDSCVVVVSLPAAHTPTCHGSSRHSMSPPLRTLN